MFGGVSAEHEVSVVTGLQALENVDTALYEPLPLYVAKTGEFFLMPKLRSRKEFLSAHRVRASFGRDAKGGYVKKAGALGAKTYPYAAYLAFHGGTGEAGPAQGLLESLAIPFTSSGVEGAVIAMNKRLTKEVLRENNIATLPDVRFFSSEIIAKSASAAAEVIEKLSLPVIVKPVHLGSSIGIAVAKSEIELQKALLAAAHVDSEVLVEPFLPGIVEYNCAVRRVSGEVEASPIEKPMSHDDILSFADKYERGGKKTASGMASLARELPAKTSPELTAKIEDIARRAFVATRLKGMARIDFMQSADGTLYLTEINPIPGSMSFYLWEASGISFKTQISELIEQAVRDAHESSAHQLDYSSDIIARFVRD